MVRGIGILNALFRQEVEYCSARERSSIRVRGLGSGPSSARGAMFRGVLASRASEGQEGGSAQGLNRTGAGFGGDQACWNRSKTLAAARGGAQAGKPRWVSILAITVESTMAAMIFKVPPHWGHFYRYRAPVWATGPSSGGQTPRESAPHRGQVDGMSID